MSTDVQNNLHNFSHYVDDEEDKVYACLPEHLTTNELEYECLVRNLPFDEQTRINTGIIRDRFRRERKFPTEIPTQSHLPPQQDYDECV